MYTRSVLLFMIEIHNPYTCQYATQLALCLVIKPMVKTFMEIYRMCIL